MSDIEWRNDVLPVSTRFDDPYFSVEDGRSETGHVFINGNQLPQRWPELDTCTIAELGFGTGLNFLETVRQWQASKGSRAKLGFISFEQYPLTVAEIEKALSAWPELTTFAERLLTAWSADGTLCNIDFTADVRLTVFFGDANDLLPKQNFQADAWYLDGFSPSKNPELWNELLMQSVFDRAKPGGTFATYTAAGFVRRNLQAAGFEVSKIAGYGRKREMLVGNKPKP